MLSLFEADFLNDIIFGTVVLRNCVLWCCRDTKPFLSLLLLLFGAVVYETIFVVVMIWCCRFAKPCLSLLLLGAVVLPNRFLSVLLLFGAVVLPNRLSFILIYDAVV